jgi:hypothetical protein
MRPIDANNFWKGLKEMSIIWQNPTTSTKNVLILPCPNSMPTFLGVFLELAVSNTSRGTNLRGGALSAVITMERLVRLTLS